MTTTGSLPGVAATPGEGCAVTAHILAGIHRLRTGVRGVPKFSLLVLAVTMMCALFAPVLAPYDPIKTNPAQALSAPGLSGHLLGTDHLGRDILSRLIYGARISVTVGFLAVVVGGAVGTLIALISAVFRGGLTVCSCKSPPHSSPCRI